MTNGARFREARLRTADGVDLQAEWWEPAREPAAVAVLCHPHPQYGGTMRSMVISALFAGLHRRVACLRFNFRGVEGSTGEHGEGVTEPRDVQAAVEAAAAAHPRVPLALIGWSFGADMALTVDDARVAGWVAIAPPLRFRAPADYEAVGADARPKLFVLAANDEFRAPADVAEAVAGWENVRVDVVSGASHFFVGRTDRVVAVVAEFVRGLGGG